ncbi:hypothetical protein LZL87_009586 [Fusarium oxysporum]|nr:hypothetical protein LZL87_009586 [Fusarium oxysporum]
MITESIGWCEVVDEYDVNEYSIKLFNPDGSQQHRNVPKDVLVAYNRRLGIQHTRYFAGPYHLEKEGSSVIIQIDGACRGNGTRSARGGWGAFFGPQSQYNQARADEEFTEEWSEHSNLLQALAYIDDVLTSPMRHITLVIIATDNSSLVQLVTDELRIIARDEDFRCDAGELPREYYELWHAIDGQAEGYRHDETVN